MLETLETVPIFFYKKKLIEGKHQLNNIEKKKSSQAISIKNKKRSFPLKEKLNNDKMQIQTITFN